MVIHNWSSETIQDSHINGIVNNLFIIEGQNLIRQMIDRTVPFSAGTIDIWGDAFTSVAGRNTSVIPAMTDATFSTDKYTTTASATSYVYLQIPKGTFNSTISSSIATVMLDDYEDGIDIKYKLESDSFATSGTLHDPDGFTNPTNAFDGDVSTYATLSGVVDVELGKTFSAKSIDYVQYHFRVKRDGSSASITIKVQTYNGTTWDDEYTIVSADIGASFVTYSGLVPIGSSVQGIRISSTSTTTHSYEMNLIMEGTTEDETSWLDYNTITTLSTFTAEPTILGVQLIPKVSSPTAGYPSIKGVSVRAE